MVEKTWELCCTASKRFMTINLTFNLCFCLIYNQKTFVKNKLVEQLHEIDDNAQLLKST